MPPESARRFAERGETLKRLLSATVLIGMMLCGSVWAQSQPQPAAKADSAGAHMAAAKSIVISGRVSSDGRHFLVDADNEWDVSNAKVLKGHEGSLVTVKCYLDANRNQIQIVSVNRVQPEVR
jgi:hypothetical protein